jgi:hypothetical protein
MKLLACLVVTVTFALATAAMAASKSKLPVVVYQNGNESSVYVPSGYMGSTGSIKVDEHSTDRPHGGSACLKVSFTKPSGWGGIAWQNPANDWGNLPGGLNLTGARTLTCWARGASGGEDLLFDYGLLKNSKFRDTAGGSVKATLTPAWKKYTISLAGMNLSDIKTGFGFTVVSHGKPVVFYLDGISYQ